MPGYARPAPFSLYVLLALPASHAAAQGVENFPNKPIHFVSSSVAGGLTDVVSRVLGERLAASPDLLDACRAAFSGQPGIEAPREFNASVAGELASLRTAGYTRVMGIFGSHRFHHTRADNLRCTSPALARQAATSFQTVITQALRTV